MNHVLNRGIALEETGTSRDSTKPKFITKLLLLEEVKRCESILLFTKSK